MSEAVEVKCFGIPEGKYRFVKGIEIYNEKLGVWQTYTLVEYYDKCPVCGRLMHVYAIKGTTWLACCSPECYEKYLNRMEVERK